MRSFIAAATVAGALIAGMGQAMAAPLPLVEAPQAPPAAVQVDGGNETGKAPASVEALVTGPLMIPLFFLGSAVVTLCAIASGCGAAWLPDER